MKAKTFSTVNTILNLSAVAVVVAIAFTWGSPVLMKLAAPNAAIERVCSQTKGCRGITISSFWDQEAERYEPVARVNISSMSDQDKQIIINGVRQSIEDAARFNPVFGPRFRNMKVTFNYVR